VLIAHFVAHIEWAGATGQVWLSKDKDHANVLEEQRAYTDRVQAITAR